MVSFFSFLYEFEPWKNSFPLQKNLFSFYYHDSLLKVKIIKVFFVLKIFLLVLISQTNLFWLIVIRVILTTHIVK